MWKWLKNIFSTSNKHLVDASDLINVPYSLCINESGKLTLQCYGLSYFIVGVIEWNNKSKKVFKVESHKTVLDLLTNKKAKKTT